MSPTPDTERMELVTRLESRLKDAQANHKYWQTLAEDRAQLLASRPEPQTPESGWQERLLRLEAALLWIETTDPVIVGAAEAKFEFSLDAAPGRQPQAPESNRAEPHRRYPGDPEISRAEHLQSHLDVHTGERRVTEEMVDVAHAAFVMANGHLLRLRIVAALVAALAVGAINSTGKDR